MLFSVRPGAACNTMIRASRPAVSLLTNQHGGALSTGDAGGSGLAIASM